MLTLLSITSREYRAPLDLFLWPVDAFAVFLFLPRWTWGTAIAAVRAEGIGSLIKGEVGGDDTESVEVGATNDELGVTNTDSLRKEDKGLGMELSPASCEMSGEKPFAEYLTSDDLKADLLHD